MKRAIFIIASKDFRDEEYFVTKDILSSKGFEVLTASDESGVAIGADGGEVDVDMKIEDVNMDDFEVLVFIGGPGCLDHLDNEKSHELTKKAFLKNAIVSAICISPVILAKSGILQGKKATVWTSPMDKKAVEILSKFGAIFKKEDVVVDGNIITANGPSAAVNFSESIDREFKKR